MHRTRPGMPSRQWAHPGTRSSPNSLWSLSSATEVKLAFRSIEGLCPVQPPAESVAQRENHWSHCSVVSHGGAAPPVKQQQPDVSLLLLPAMTVQQQKSAPYVRQQQQQLLSHGIYIERHAAACSRLLSVLLPFPPGTDPRISAHPLSSPV